MHLSTLPTYIKKYEFIIVMIIVFAIGGWTGTLRGIYNFGSDTRDVVEAVTVKLKEQAETKETYRRESKSFGSISNMHADIVKQFDSCKSISAECTAAILHLNPGQYDDVQWQSEVKKLYLKVTSFAKY